MRSTRTAFCTSAVCQTPPGWSESRWSPGLEKVMGAIKPTKHGMLRGLTPNLWPFKWKVRVEKPFGVKTWDYIYMYIYIYIYRDVYIHIYIYVFWWLQSGFGPHSEVSLQSAERFPRLLTSWLRQLNYMKIIVA